MQILSMLEISQISGAASTETIVKSGARIFAKNLARGFLIGSGIGTVAAVAWSAYDVYRYTNE